MPLALVIGIVAMFPHHVIGIQSVVRIARGNKADLCGLRLGYKCVDENDTKPAPSKRNATAAECFAWCQINGSKDACCQYNEANKKCRHWSNDLSIRPTVVDDADNTNKMAFTIGCGQCNKINDEHLECVGRCRTSTGGLGDWKKPVGDNDLAECAAECANDAGCFAYEHKGQHRRCEIHREEITQVSTLDTKENGTSKCGIKFRK